MSSTSPQPCFDPIGKFTYDLSRWPSGTWIPVVWDNTAVQDFTLATTTEIARIVEAFGSTTRVTAANYPMVVTDASALTLLHDGNSTDFTRIFQFFTPIDAYVDRIDFNFGCGLNVSAYTAGNFAISRVDPTINVFKSPTQQQNAFPVTQVNNVTTTNMTAVDNQIVIFNGSYVSPFPLYAGGLLTISLNIQATVGTGTYQKGLLSVFPYQNNAGTKVYSISAFRIWYRPLPTPGTVLQPATFAPGAVWGPMVGGGTP